MEAQELVSLQWKTLVLKFLSYPKSLLATFFSVLWTAVWGLLCIVTLTVARSIRMGDFFLFNWSKVIINAFNITIDVEGEENLPDEGCIFVFNHSSDFDIVAFHTAIKKSARFGAKMELFKIPILGHSMRAVGVLPIFRQNREKVFKLYEKSINRVKKGESFILAGEGTRQKKHGVGERFKSGPFIFAIQAGAPIVPVVFVGAYEVLRKGDLFGAWGLWNPTIKVKILPPVETTGYEVKTRQELQKKVREKMALAYTEGRQEWLKA